MRILISSASRKVNLVRAFRDALAREGGGAVLAADASPHAPALYFADERRIVPSIGSPEFIPEMLRLCAEAGVRLVVPTADEELPLYAEHRDAFEACGAAVMVSPIEAVRLCQDKRRFADFCLARGFAVPRILEPSALRDPSDFPVFLRPCRGRGSNGAVRADSRADLETELRRHPGALVQKYVSAAEYTVDLFADFDGRVLSAVPRERIRVFGGESFVGMTRRDPALIGEAVRLAEALGLWGHVTIQCFLDGEAVKFIEVNPRFGGGASLGFAAGAPTPLWLVKLLKGERLEPRLGDFRDRYLMLRYTEDLFLSEEDVQERWGE